mmetsp:Transcript_18906/g.26033  ORF Transcript_18906/g.26033 Transcript_18906/m.26033 type:complete len:276 (-) Transcript_18906:481-1308(-)
MAERVHLSVRSDCHSEVAARADIHDAAGVLLEQQVHQGGQQAALGGAPHPDAQLPQDAVAPHICIGSCCRVRGAAVAVDGSANGVLLAAHHLQHQLVAEEVHLLELAGVDAVTETKLAPVVVSGRVELARIGEQHHVRIARGHGAHEHVVHVGDAARHVLGLPRAAHGNHAVVLSAPLLHPLLGLLHLVAHRTQLLIVLAVGVCCRHQPPLSALAHNFVQLATHGGPDLAGVSPHLALTALVAWTISLAVRFGLCLASSCIYGNHKGVSVFSHTS